jgi:multiple sugar transport system permease protein
MTSQQHTRKGFNQATKRAPWVLLAPFLALFLLTFILPILTAVGSSFTKVTRGGLFGERA